jgi:putative ABC transport system permease protein
VLYPLGDMSLNFDTAVFGETYANGAEPIAAGNDVSPGYFRTMGIPLLRGRDFSDSDTEHAPHVAIVNEAFVRAFLHGRPPLGTRIRVAGWNGTKATWSAIVGIVGDERRKLSVPPTPAIYSPVLQAPPSYISAVVHGPADRATLARELNAAFAAAAPSIPPPGVYTMNDRMALSTQQARLTASLLGALSIVALLLSLAGIFGVMSFSVTQRTNEFGIRMAHGASTRNIVADVLRRAVITAGVGIAFGIVIAAIGANAISGQLHEVSPFDPLTFGVVVILLLCCACVAALQPAIRATRVQPSVALRYE